MATETARRPGLPLTPFAPAALGAMAGIAADRYGLDRATTSWMLIAVAVAAVAWLLSWVDGRLTRATIGLAFIGIGGGWHHYWWSDLASDDIARGHWSSPGLAWVRGNLAEAMTFHRSPQAGRDGVTLGSLKITAVREGEAWRRRSGIVLISIVGDAREFRHGEPVEVAGMLAEIAGPLNLGEPDARDRYRARGIQLRLAVDSLAGIWRDPNGAFDWFPYWLGRCRDLCERRLTDGLNSQTAPLAAALLLGQRDEVDPDDNDAFARTGTMHLLAISGLHLQVLAALLLWTSVRILGLNRKLAFIGVIIVTGLYAVLVGAMPSVVRSIAMTVFACSAVLRDRHQRSGNMMALAALITLAFNPSDLFDVGCQLSFVGVAALVWVVPLVKQVIERGPLHPLDRLERQYEASWRKAIRRGFAWLGEAGLLSAVVWLVGLPLAALRFHLLSPVSILLNLPLVPLTSLALIASGLSLMFALVWAPLAWPFAQACSLMLYWTQTLVRLGAHWDWGHRFVAGPHWGWVLVYYGLLAAAVCLSATGWVGRWALRASLVVCVLVGALSILLPARGVERLQADVLAVGHGLAVVVQAPSGRTMIYDCGRMGEPRVGRRVVAPALWARGIERIDVVVLSHADSDHFNGLHDIIDRFRIGEICVPQGFGGSTNPEAIKLLERIQAKRIRIRSIVAGDQIDLGRDVTVEILHPRKDWLPTAPDNDRSLVLDVSSSSRHLLLTGDLDGAGSAELRTLPSRPIDLFLAPHHGGKSANPKWLYDWARPGGVIVSQRAPRSGSADALTPLEARKITVFRTWNTGALHVVWYPGAMNVKAFTSPIEHRFGVASP
jgi:competence protein ComEC